MNLAGEKDAFKTAFINAMKTRFRVCAGPIDEHAEFVFDWLAGWEMHRQEEPVLSVLWNDALFRGWNARETWLLAQRRSFDEKA